MCMSNGSDEFDLAPRMAHVIVCGNEKGGSGKSTLSIHLADALMQAGHKVATIDLDTRQLSLTRYVENRRRWSKKKGIALELPTHFTVDRIEGELVTSIQDAESRELSDRTADIESNHDFIVIDTPGSNTYLQRLAHMMAGTLVTPILVTPINDSFVDFDVLARIDSDTNQITGISQYARAVRDACRERRRADSGIIDWVVVCNRLANIQSRNEQRIESCVNQLSTQLGFRVADGVTERVVFREFFPIGLTALDEFDEPVPGMKPTLSHLAARQEIRKLVSIPQQPTRDANRKRADRRKMWPGASSRKIALPDIFVN